MNGVNWFKTEVLVYSTAGVAELTSALRSRSQEYDKKQRAVVAAFWEGGSLTHEAPGTLSQFAHSTKSKAHYANSGQVQQEGQ
jgi:hypothetical protein